MVDDPLLLGGRYVERVNLDSAAVDAFYLRYSYKSPEIMFAIDLTGKRAGGPPLLGGRYAERGNFDKETNKHRNKGNGKRGTRTRKR